MPPNCKVCSDPRLESIDSEIVSGKSIPAIGREFGLKESGLYRHREKHMTIVKSIETSRPAGLMATVEHLQALDQQLAEVQAIAMRRAHTQAATAALSQRIRIAMEISALRDEIKPKEKRVRHILELDNERAMRVASSFITHQKFLSGEVIDGKATKR